MIPVFQSKISGDDGDCWAACVASIFEIDISRVVDIHSPENVRRHWTIGVEEWLRPANLSMVLVPHGADIPKGYAILVVTSTMFEGCTHAVVCQDGEVVFDPNPEAGKRERGDYMAAAHRYWVFHPLDPSKPITLEALR